MDKTFITIREFAGKLGVSEKTVYRMLTDNQIPFALKIGGQWRFRIDAVEAWLAGQTVMAMGGEDANYMITVRTALNNGAMLYRIHGNNRDETLDELLSNLPNTAGLDVSGIKIAVLTQESLASSSIKGVACMRPGRNTPFFVPRSIIIMGFLEKPVDFKAFDREKVGIIFLTLPANEVEEAILEVRLRRLLMEPEFLAAVKKQPSRRELIELVKETEALLLPSPSQKSAAGHGKTIVSPTGASA
jgi:nitrogen PTS system EIIA component